MVKSCTETDRGQFQPQQHRQSPSETKPSKSRECVTKNTIKFSDTVSWLHTSTVICKDLFKGTIHPKSHELMYQAKQAASYSIITPDKHRMSFMCYSLYGFEYRSISEAVSSLYGTFAVGKLTFFYLTSCPSSSALCSVKKSRCINKQCGSNSTMQIWVKGK